MNNQILKQIDEEVERLENMIEENPEWEHDLMDRIQGVLWVRNLVYKDSIQQPHDVEEFYKGNLYTDEKYDVEEFYQTKG